MERFVRIFLAFLIISAGSLPEGKAIAQEIGNVRRQQVFIEGGGPGGGVISLNYDTRFLPKQNGWGIRAGAGFWTEDTQRIVSVPVQLNYLVGKRQHLFEVGGGPTFYYTNIAASYWDIDSNEGLSLFGSFSLGYRYQPLAKGLTARAGASLLVGSFLPVISPQLGVGYVF